MAQIALPLRPLVRDLVEQATGNFFAAYYAGILAPVIVGLLIAAAVTLPVTCTAFAVLHDRLRVPSASPRSPGDTAACPPDRVRATAITPYGTLNRTSASATGVPLRRAYVSRSRTSLGVRGRNPGPPQQLLWNPTPAFSRTARARQAAESRLLGAANAEPTWIIGSAQRGQFRCLARSWGCLKEARQGRQTYEVFPWLTGPA